MCRRSRAFAHLRGNGIFLGAGMTETDRQARRREQGRKRQARYRKAHQGDFRTIQIPARLHGTLSSRARSAGLSIARYIALKAGA